MKHGLKIWFLILCWSIAVANQAMGDDNKDISDLFTCDMMLKFDRSKLPDNCAEAVIYDVCQMGRQYTCVTLVDGYLSVYKEGLSRMVGNKNKDAPLFLTITGKIPLANTNIFDNFKELQSRHDEVFTEVEKILSGFVKTLPPIKDQATLQEYHKKLLIEMDKVKAALTKAAYYDDLFFTMVGAERDALATKMGGIALLAQLDSCKDVKPIIEAAGKDFNFWASKIVEIHDYVTKAQTKREYVADISYQYLTTLLQERYAEYIGEALADLKDRLSQVFRIDRLGYEIGTWWLEATRGGLARGLHTRYLQYEEPMRLLQVYKEQALEYIEKVKSLDSVSMDARQVLIDDLNVRILTIDRNLKPLVDGGWQGVYANEKMMVGRYQMHLDYFVPACQGAVDLFLQNSAKVVDLVGFRIAEKSYFDLVNICVKR